MTPLLLTFALALAGSAAPLPERFSDELLVREVSRIVALPDSLTAERFAALDPASFQVLEDGQYRTVLKVSPLPTWAQVIYLDRGTLPPAELFRSTLGLAGRAEALAARGPVTVVVADPEPRVLLAGSREPRRIAQELIDLAAAARVARDRERTRFAIAPAALAASAGRLLDWAGEQRLAGPVALLWGLPGQSPEGAAADLAATARALAARDWVVLPLAISLPPDRPALAPDGRSDLERTAEKVRGEPPLHYLFLIRRKLGQWREQMPLWTAPESLDPFLLPALSPLRQVAAATAGLVVTDERQIDGALDRLGQRVEVVYASPGRPDGREPRVEITLVPEGKAVRLAPREALPPH